MVSSNTPSNVPKPSHSSKFVGPRMNNFCKKASSDRHSNVRGKDRRIVLPIGCADRVFELRKRLGHRTAGQTVEWLLIQAKASVDAVLNTNPSAPQNQNGDEMPGSISMSKSILTSASDVEISADEVARFLFGDHSGYGLEEDQQKEKE